jgi:hypothetical protein
MGFLPHPQVPLGHLRPYDIFLLLALGAIWELASRTMLIRYKAKPLKLRQREESVKVLQANVTRSRKKGPSAFVETSKLERQLLAQEKALAETMEKREVLQSSAAKRSKNANYVVSLLVFMLWYGVPIMGFEAHRLETTEILSVEEGQELANGAYRAFLFPISVVGLGLRFSKWGLNNPQSSAGALLAFWSAQTTVAKIMDGVEALIIV